MKKTQVMSLAASAMLVAGGAASAAALVAQPALAASAIDEGILADRAGSPMVLLPNAAGAFDYSQGALSSLDEIRQALGQIPQVLCGAQAPASRSLSEAEAAAWSVTVGGSVSSAFTATLGELAEEGEARVVMMGCSCAGNPSGEYGAINAETTGVTLASIMERAGVLENANTVVFTSEDGYEVALPLSFVKHRYAMVVYAINGEELANSVGGTNQVWMGATSAQNFARNVVSIQFEERETPPAVPGLVEVGA